MPSAFSDGGISRKFAENAYTARFWSVFSEKSTGQAIAVVLHKKAVPSDTGNKKSPGCRRRIGQKGCCAVFHRSLPVSLDYAFTVDPLTGVKIGFAKNRTVITPWEPGGMPPNFREASMRLERAPG